MDDTPKKFKVIYNREGCIEVLSCAAVFPERWKLNLEDNKADLVGGTQDSIGNWVFEFTADELEKFKESARVCPAKVIKIVDLTTGEEIE